MKKKQKYTRSRLLVFLNRAELARRLELRHPLFIRLELLLEFEELAAPLLPLLKPVKVLLGLQPLFAPLVRRRRSNAAHRRALVVRRLASPTLRLHHRPAVVQGPSSTCHSFIASAVHLSIVYWFIRPRVTRSFARRKMRDEMWYTRGSRGADIGGAGREAVDECEGGVMTARG